MKKLFLILMALAMAFTAFAGGEKEPPGGEKPMPEKVVLRYNNMTEPESLDPTLMEGVPEHNIYMSLFEGLVSYDPETLAPVPGTAERWEISNDALTYTFYLRKNAVWSDGVPITAHSFVDSWLRFMSPETAATYAYLPAMVIKGAAEYNAGEAGPEKVAIRALDDYTFQFDLIGPAPYTLGMLPHYAFGVVPIHAIEKYGTEWTRPENFVGNGPFILKDWIPQDKVIVEKSETYWDADAVQLDEVVYYPITDVNTAINMFLQEDIDWIDEVPDARLEEMQLRNDYHINATMGYYYYQFNQTKPPFNDARIRKALSMAINRQELVDRVTRGESSPPTESAPPWPATPKSSVLKRARRTPGPSWPKRVTPAAKVSPCSPSSTTPRRDTSRSPNTSSRSGRRFSASSASWRTRSGAPIWTTSRTRTSK